MKKSQIRILAILAAIALLLGIALFALRYEKAPEVLPALVEIPQAEINQLVFTSNTANINLHLQEGSWQLLLPEGTLPAKQDTVSTMLQQLCSLRPQQVLEDADPELFAASTLQASIDILSGSGTDQVAASQQIRIYSMNAITDQLYVQVGQTLYLTDTSLMKIFPGSQLELLQQYPIPKPDNHRTVTVENFSGQIQLSCDPALTGGSEDTWYVQQGALWIPADQNAAYNFYFLTWDMHWKSTAAVIGDATNLADFGLDNPQVIYTLTYGDQVFRLYLGENLPDGTTYAMCDGSPLIYTMDTLLATWLAEATMQSVLPQS